MSSIDYWAKRKAEFVVSQLDKAEQTAETMKRTYAKAQKHLVDQVDKIFLKYQRDYGLSETQARAFLKRSGVDVMKLKREMQNGVQSDEIKRILADMDSAAYASRIEKLIQSQKEIDALMLSLSQNDNRLLANHLKSIAEDSYLHEMFLIQRRAKVAFEFNALDPKYVDKLLRVNWSGKHFSQIIWNNHAELGQTLKEEYLVNYLTGRSSFDMSKVIEERFGVEGYKARRLVRTESTFFSAELEAKAYEEAGIEQYEYVSVLDDRTTHICKSKDGKIYNVKDRRAGVNYPPLHVFCRATTIAHISDEWLKEVDGDVFDDTLGYKGWKNIVNTRLYRNKDKNKRNPINIVKQKQLTREFRRRGGLVWQNEEAERLLKNRNASAMAFNADLIVLSRRPTISEVLEELYHAEQFKDGRMIDDPIVKIKCEIEAQHYLLSVSKRYNIPIIETQQTKQNLKFWEEELRKYEN